MRHGESSENWREADPPPRYHHQIASEREKSDRNDYSSLPIAHSCRGITQISAKIKESPLSSRRSKADSLNSEKTSQTLNLPQSIRWGMHQNETRCDQRSEISDWLYMSSKSRTRRKRLKSKPFRESPEKNRGLAREDTYMRILRWIASPRSSI